MDADYEARLSLILGRITLVENTLVDSAQPAHSFEWGLCNTELFEARGFQPEFKCPFDDREHCSDPRYGCYRHCLLKTGISRRTASILVRAAMLGVK